MSGAPFVGRRRNLPFPHSPDAMKVRTNGDFWAVSGLAAFRSEERDCCHSPGPAIYVNSVGRTGTSAYERRTRPSCLSFIKPEIDTWMTGVADKADCPDLSSLIVETVVLLETSGTAMR
jgi:hypothetical protein